MNNREFIVAVRGICDEAIVADQGFAQAFGEVCALVNAEALKPSHNNARVEISPDACSACHGCGNVEISHINQCYRCNGTGKTSPVA